MALSKQKKQEAVNEVQGLLSSSKMTVFARYQGTPVKAMQELRSQAKDNGTTVKVIKNRLFKKALSDSEPLKNIDAGILRGQLVYAFNDSDEVAPAQNLAAFAKTNPQIDFVGAISEDGRLLSADDVKELANLPTKDQLKAQLIATLNLPWSGLMHVMAGNVRGVLSVLNARAKTIGSQ
ncbi:50S ribosomal protein L10 [Candidatus Saccharibacteria bacterium]|nr:50S ribosomal protein L10 [Candidatus Saccharibacteria bacterium]